MESTSNLNNNYPLIMIGRGELGGIMLGFGVVVGVDGWLVMLIYEILMNNDLLIS